MIGAATDLLTIRPLVSMAKEDITLEARALGTYPISLLPDEDCCTLFTPRHPLTRAKRHQVEAAERDLPIAAMVDAATAEPVIEQVEWPVVKSTAGR